MSFVRLMRSVALVVGMVGAVFVIAIIYQLGLKPTPISIHLPKCRAYFPPCKKRYAREKCPRNFRVNEPPVIRVPNANEASFPTLTYYGVLIKLSGGRWGQMKGVI